MEESRFLLRPTLMARVTAAGGKAVLLTAKKKTVSLLGERTTLAVAAEEPAPEFAERYGPVPGIYSAEINHWLWRAAAGLLETHADLDLLYVHTTDFPMHAWPPGDPRSSAHLRRLDELIGEALRAAPGAAPFATADHGMNGKNLVYDLSQALASRGRPVRLALSAEKDRYVRHHRTFGGTAWVWLNRAVFGDAATVFGDLPDGQESEVLPPEYRSHGSLHETSVPLLAWNHADYPAPPAYNKDLLTPLLNGWLS